MKLIALTTIKHDGEICHAGESFNVDKESAKRLIENGAARETESVSKKEEINAEELYEMTDDLNTLNVTQLKAICDYLGIPKTGNKEALIHAIEEEETDE